MSDFREHARNHLRTAAGTYIWAEIHSALLALERRLLAASEVSFELESDSACWIRSDAVVGFYEFPNSLAAEEPKG